MPFKRPLHDLVVRFETSPCQQRLSPSRLPTLSGLKLCGVDLSLQAFGLGAVETLAARINVIVINPSTAQLPSLHILFDRASKAYLHEAVLDAMLEFSGLAKDGTSV